MLDIRQTLRIELIKYKDRPITRRLNTQKVYIFKCANCESEILYIKFDINGEILDIIWPWNQQKSFEEIHKEFFKTRPSIVEVVSFKNISYTNWGLDESPENTLQEIPKVYSCSTHLWKIYDSGFSKYEYCEHCNTKK